MFIVRVWCLPQVSEELLQKLYEQISGAVMRVEGLGVKRHNIACFFPPDMMKQGLGEEIIVEAVLLKRPQTASALIRQEQLAKALGEAVHKMFPATCVECFVNLFDSDQGFWSSKRQ